MEKIKEFWSNCPLYTKLVSVAAPLLLIADIVVCILVIVELSPTDIFEGIGKMSMALMWALIGPVWWKRHKLFSVCCFGLALVNVFHAALLFLR